MPGILFLFFLVSLLFTGIASAQVMSNSNYKLIWGTLNMTGGDVSGSQYKLSTTTGEFSQGLFSGTNYKVRAGFQYIRFTTPFSFTVSPTLIDFGIATPNNPLTRTNTLTVSTGASSGYTIVVSQDHPLKSSDGNQIPDTTCDNGDCNSTRASTWESSLAYGFGYRCDNLTGTDCSSDFGASFYKSFPASESAQTVMSATNVGNKRRAGQITYKVNVSPTQPAGVYTNTITYIASPGF